MPKTTDPQTALRKLLVSLLSKNEAHVGFDKAVKDMPAGLMGQKPANVPHTPWRLLEHLRIAQLDIVEFTLDTRHKSPKWPDEYWPAGDGPPSLAAWNKSVAAHDKDRQRMIDVVKDESIDLLASLPHGDGQTVVREATLLADHTAYHVGQLIVVRRALGAWED